MKRILLYFCLSLMLLACSNSNLPKGIGFTQFVRAKMLACHVQKQGSPLTVVDAAKQLGYGQDTVQYIEKAVLGTTTDAGFAAPLVQQDTYKGDFLELLRNATIFDKLQGYRAVPFNIKINGQATGGTASWVGEGAKKPLTNPTFDSVEIKEHKLAAITVYTQELLRRSDPAVDQLVLNDLIAASKTLIDETFLGTQAQTDITPAGILNGVAAVPATAPDGWFTGVRRRSAASRAAVVSRLVPGQAPATESACRAGGCLAADLRRADRQRRVAALCIGQVDHPVGDARSGAVSPATGFVTPAGQQPLPDPRMVRQVIANRQARARFFDAELFFERSGNGLSPFMRKLHVVFIVSLAVCMSNDLNLYTRIFF